MIVLEPGSLRFDQITVEGGDTTRLQWQLAGLPDLMAETETVVCVLYTPYGMIQAVIDGDLITVTLTFAITAQAVTMPFSLKLLDRQVEPTAAHSIAHGEIVVSESPHIVDTLNPVGLYVIPPESYTYLGNLFVDTYAGTLTPSVGQLELTLSPSLAFVPGQYISCSTESSTILASILSYESISGATTLNVVQANGPESQDWNIGISARPTQSADLQHDLLSGVSGGTNGDRQHVTSAFIEKVSGIEDDATRDMTGAEIKTAYEGEPDTNAYTDADAAKVQGIEDDATRDMTGAEIKTAYEGEPDTNAYTDADLVAVAQLIARHLVMSGALVIESINNFGGISIRADLSSLGNTPDQQRLDLMVTGGLSGAGGFKFASRRADGAASHDFLRFHLANGMMETANAHWVRGLMGVGTSSAPSGATRLDVQGGDPWSGTMRLRQTSSTGMHIQTMHAGAVVGGLSRTELQLQDVATGQTRKIRINNGTLEVV